MDDLEKAEGLSHSDMPDSMLKYDDLLAMVQRLPQAYRTVFNLYAIEGYTHDEIGKLLGISDGTSKSNLFKARDKLKDMIMKAERRADRPLRTEMYTGDMDHAKLNISYFDGRVLK